MNLAEFVDRFRQAITGAVLRSYPPLYDEAARGDPALDPRGLLRRPLGAQAEAVRATALALRSGRAANVVGEMGSGKAQPLDSKVLTPTGWTRMGDLRVGDLVVNPAGGTSRVAGVFPQQPKEVFRVTFSDGASTECCAEHLWLVNTPLRRWRGQPGRVLSLGDILARGLTHTNGNRQHFVPLVEPVAFEGSADLPIDPYLLGALLGDGGFSGGFATFTTADEEMIERLRQLVPTGTEVVPRDRFTYGFRSTAGARRRTARGTFAEEPNPLNAALARLGLLGHKSAGKFVPEAYLRAPVEARVALLQGLFDTDGCPAGPGGVELTTVSDRLASDVAELVRSLGGTVSVGRRHPFYRRDGVRRAGLPARRLHIRLPVTVHPFRLGRKAEVYRPATKYGPARAIASVEPVGTKPAQCIALDSPNQLYVTDDYIVTHNTFIGAAAAYLSGCRRTFVLCPPHLVRKWRREILATVPSAQVAVVRSIADLEASRRLGGLASFTICSREQAKLGYRWVPAVVWRPARAAGRLLRDEAGEPVRLACCPSCFAPAADDDGVPLAWDELRAKRRRCQRCRGPLWQADRTGPHRVPLADHVRRRMRGHFDLLIADEMHEYKARGSAQGLAAAALVGACRKTLTLTGTAFGGYSSTLFYLLWRFSPAVRAEFGYGDEARWVGRYGIVERITKRDPDAYTEDGRQSKRRSFVTRTVEKPGVSPAVLFHLIGNTVFLRLADVADALPPYEERVVALPLDRDGERSQAACYRRLADDLHRAVVAALAAGSKRLLAAYLQALLAYPDACTRVEVVLDPATGEVVADAPALPANRLYPKERALLELVAAERRRSRRVLVYITHTESRDLSPRLCNVLGRGGYHAVVLKAGTVEAARREEWVAARVREGAEVLICHPRLVQTGLDLVDWPTIVWFELDYSVYVMRQASRRSWRIGQSQPVEVHHLVYEGTLQAEALALVAAKMRSALMVEGELPEDGLAALEGDGPDVLVALAQRLAGGGSTEAGSLEALFARARAEAAAADRPLAAPGLAPPRQSEPDAGHERRPSIAAGDRRAPAVTSFAELAALVRRPARRAKPVHPDQLSLFAS